MGAIKNSFAFYRILLLIGVLLLTAGNFFYLYQYYRLSEAYGQIVEKGRRVAEIKPTVDAIQQELWGIVSVYDPQKSKKVEFSQGRQYDLLRKAQQDIYYAKEGVTDNDLSFQLDILQRTLNSLARNIDFIKSQLALQEFDIDSTKKFFRDSTKLSILTDSYVDQMQSQMEDIKTINVIIYKNVDIYLEKEINLIGRLNENTRKQYKQWLFINGVGILMVSGIVQILCLTAP